MDKLSNIYCDESHPMQNDGQDFMILGALICDKSKYRNIKKSIQQLRKKYGLDFNYEFKWQKVNKMRYPFYEELISYIANCSDIRLKINVALGKRLLVFDDKYTYEKWYHLMYYYMLKNFIDYHKDVCDDKSFNLLIDRKDTNSSTNYTNIAKALNRRFYKAKCRHSFTAYACNSNEFLLIQCIDVIIGAVSYHYKRNYANKYKTALMKHIASSFNIDFDNNTPINSDKVSLYIWKPKGLIIQ